MDIQYLQKLDLILKVANNDDDSINYKIVFGLNGQTYYGDFYIKVFDSKGTVFQYSQENTSNKLEVEFKEIESLSTSSEMNNVKCQNKVISSPEAYLQFIKGQFDFDKLELTEDLPPYIYNVKNIKNYIPISFMEVGTDTQFDFISIAPEDYFLN